MAAANFLAARGDDVVLTDSERESGAAVSARRSASRARSAVRTTALLDGVGTIVLSPGVPRDDSAAASQAGRVPIPVIGEDRARVSHMPQGSTVIAITGSNGKSTTTALIGEILKVAGRQPIVAGNIGEPLIAALDPEQPRTYVLELSSFQLETVDTFRANVALLLNITPDHMDRYPNFDAYAAAKYRIFRNQQPHDVAIVNASDRRGTPRDAKARVWRFSARRRSTKAHFSTATISCCASTDSERRIPRASLKLEGTANVENALAAWLAARAVGVDDVSVQIAFGSFAGLPHRMVLVRELDGVRWINDSKGTNVDATLKSLESFPPSSVWLILGGKDKAGEFERMRDLVREKARGVLTIGSAATRSPRRSKVRRRSSTPATCNTPSPTRASTRSRATSVLLSPACASFDQYRNFEHRGEHFEELVRGCYEPQTHLRHLPLRRGDAHRRRRHGDDLSAPRRSSPCRSSGRTTRTTS